MIKTFGTTIFCVLGLAWGCGKTQTSNYQPQNEPVDEILLQPTWAPEGSKVSSADATVAGQSQATVISAEEFEHVFSRDDPMGLALIEYVCGAENSGSWKQNSDGGATVSCDP